MSLSLWHKGQTIGEEIIEPTDDELLEEEQAEQELIDGEAEEINQNPNALRMLVEAYKWHQGRELGLNDRNQFPVLVVADALERWSKPNSPIILDT